MGEATCTTTLTTGEAMPLTTTCRSAAPVSAASGTRKLVDWASAPAPATPIVERSDERQGSRGRGGCIELEEETRRQGVAFLPVDRADRAENLAVAQEAGGGA